MYLTNTFVHGFECARDAANLVVDSRRAIQRDDHLVQMLHDLAGVPGKKQARAEDRQSHAERPQRGAEPKEIGVHQWLATGKDYPSHAQGCDIGGVPLQIDSADLTGFAGLPYVTHDATAIAAAMRIKDENRQLGNDWIHASTLRP